MLWVAQLKGDASLYLTVCVCVCVCVCAQLKRDAANLKVTRPFMLFPNLYLTVGEKNGPESQVRLHLDVSLDRNPCVLR